MEQDISLSTHVPHYGLIGVVMDSEKPLKIRYDWQTDTFDFDKDLDMQLTLSTTNFGLGTLGYRLLNPIFIELAFTQKNEDRYHHLLNQQLNLKDRELRVECFDTKYNCFWYSDPDFNKPSKKLLKDQIEHIGNICYHSLKNIVHSISDYSRDNQLIKTENELFEKTRSVALERLHKML